jgi:hypothetical protein
LPVSHVSEISMRTPVTSLRSDSSLDQSVARFEQDALNFKRTAIWKMLYDFPKDCVLSAIQKINKYNGCIIADNQ